MNAKKAAPLILALVLGLFAFWMMLHMINKQQSAGKAPPRPMVVIAKGNVDAGTVLGPDNLMTGEISADAVPTTVFKDPAELMGRVASVPIIDGQVITQTLLAPKGVGAGLQAVVPVGMRAVTLDINEITGVAGNVVPGCHVDVIQTFHDDRTGEQMARTIVQNVQVTAIGMHHNAGDPPDSNVHSVTVLVTPANAELLELASMTGRPRLSLRSGNDLNLVQTPGVTLTDLKGRDSAHRDVYNTVQSDVVGDVPTTQPDGTTVLTSASTRPSEQPSQWTMHVVRGGTETEVRFSLRKPVATLIGQDADEEP
jgi:pilus assembly protein CpaB